MGGSRNTIWLSSGEADRLLVVGKLPVCLAKSGSGELPYRRVLPLLSSATYCSLRVGGNHRSLPLGEKLPLERSLLLPIAAVTGKLPLMSAADVTSIGNSYRYR